jgi:uncharacterized protein (DUF433 family)
VIGRTLTGFEHASLSLESRIGYVETGVPDVRELEPAQGLVARGGRPAASRVSEPGSTLAGGYTGSVMSRRSPVVHSDPDILGGTPVFVGTRVPVRSLFDYLEAGDTLDEFLRQFPSVHREQAVEALEFARETLLTSARPA